MVGNDDATDLELSKLWTVGREAWPGLALDEADFVHWLRQRLEPGLDPRLLVAADLYLVAACLLGVPDAVKRFIEGPLAGTRRHIARIVGRPDVGDDLMQGLAVMLLSPDPSGAPPRIVQYTGRGALAVWLRMTAVRRALNVRRGQGKNVYLEEVAFEQISDHNPELSALRRV